MKTKTKPKRGVRGQGLGARGKKATAVRKTRWDRAAVGVPPPHLVGELSGALANANGKTADTAGTFERAFDKHLARQRASKPSTKHQSPSTALVVIGSGRSAEVLEVLTSTERRQRERLERTISRGIESVLEVGAALREIRDGRLYRSTHARFEDYTRDLWNLGRADAYRQIRAAEIAAEISPIGDKLGLKLTAESQFRPLTHVEPSDYRPVLEMVAERSPKGPDGKPRPTAEIIRQVVHEQVTPGDELEREKAQRRARNGRPAAGHRESSDTAGEGITPGSSEADWFWNGERKAYAPQLHRLRRQLEDFRDPAACDHDLAAALCDLLYTAYLELLPEKSIISQKKPTAARARSRVIVDTSRE